jgi:dinuclear metal center YbgI/SA1388 family protein
MKRDRIIDFINEYLKWDRYQDYSPVGLQIEGKDEVKKIIFGVSLNLMLLEEAVKEKADMIIVHHGMFFKRESAIIEGAKKKRVKMLLDNEITLLGYHLCLDMHEEVGNNIQIAKRLDLIESEMYGSGYFGFYNEEISRDEFSKKVDEIFKSTSTKFLYGNKNIKKVYIISGSSPLSIETAHKLGCDTFVTGESSESSKASAYELNMNFYASGHHNTEKFGLLALMDVIKKEFDVEVKFIDIENPI